MKAAVIDIGTNSCRLLIANLTNHDITPVYRNLITTRLGDNIANLQLSPKAMDKTILALDQFKEVMENHLVKTYRAIATSAVREASNQEAFLQLVKDKCNINVEVISGEEEAYLSYLGVRNSLKLEMSPLVIDLGGGSTEVIYENTFFLSVPIGAVRVGTNNYSSSDIREAFKILFNKKAEFSNNPLVFVGGTATSLVAIKEGLEEYNSQLIHGYTLTRNDIEGLYKKLQEMPINIRQSLAGLQPERADIITEGTLIMLVIMDILGKDEMIVSESDLMEGTLLTLDIN
ncbi:MAG: Ppx/GppA family phosphatase [Syntrophomonadaceae bacterium]|nr:Ppx/GppA family phosphatase [Syntrophomonadaceae bacterium]